MLSGLQMDLNSLIQLKRERFEELGREMEDPRLFDNRKRAEEIMRAQSAMIEELSTPLIPISDDVMVMPLVGPIDPATNLGRSGVRAVHSSAASRASRAPARFNSYASGSSA